MVTNELGINESTVEGIIDFLQYAKEHGVSKTTKVVYFDVGRDEYVSFNLALFNPELQLLELTFEDDLEIEEDDIDSSSDEETGWEYLLPDERDGD